jgi:hypothetical protein
LAFGEARGLRKRPFFDDPALKALFDRGLEHEHRFLASLKSSSKRVHELTAPNNAFGTNAWWQQYAADTLAAIRSGAAF